MKRYLLLLIPMILTISIFFAGCSVGEGTRENELKTSLETTYDELSATFSGTTGQYSLVAEYLKSWASKNKMEIVESGSDHMVIENPATEDCKDKEPIVLQCPVETEDLNASMQPLAVSLSSLLGPESHGKITLIITEINDGKYTGASSVNTKYYQCDNFINIRHGDDMQLYTSGSYEMDSTMTSVIETAQPSYSHAFAITMSTSGYHDPFDFDSHYPNPIQTIGSLLATEKSSGQLFQLASFECEATDGYTPTSATAIVVVDGNDVSSFTKKFEKSYNNAKNRFEKLQDNFVYTMTETEMPQTVMTNQTSDNIISLMYTLKTGTYFQDEDSGEIISASYMSYMTTSNNTLKLIMTSRSTDKAVLADMDAEFLTTSGLCDISYTSSKPHITWTSNIKDDPAKFLTDALGTESSIVPDTLASSECDVFAAGGASNIVSYRCNIHNSDSAMMNIIHFMESLAQ